MKTLQELYDEMLASDELKNAFVEAAKAGKLADLLKEQGCEATADEFVAFLGEKAQGEMTDEELDEAAGGSEEEDAAAVGTAVGFSIVTGGIGCAILAIMSAIDNKISTQPGKICDSV